MTDKELRELAEKAITAFQVYRGYSVVDEYKGYVADKKTTRQLAKIFVDAEKKLQQAANPARIIELLDRVAELEQLYKMASIFGCMTNEGRQALGRSVLAVAEAEKRAEQAEARDTESFKSAQYWEGKFQQAEAQCAAYRIALMFYDHPLQRQGYVASKALADNDAGTAILDQNRRMREALEQIVDVLHTGDASVTKAYDMTLIARAALEAKP